MPLLKTFAENPNCCYGRGGFVRSPQTTKTVMDGKNEAENAKNFTKHEGYKHGAEQPSDIQAKIVNETQLQEHHMEGMLQAAVPDKNAKVDWSHLASQTGIRPNVSKYSLRRYSIDEWRKHNEKILDCTEIAESNTLNYNIQTAISAGFGNMDQAQSEDNLRLKQKARDLFRWKVEVEIACKEIAKEVELLELERQRIKGASRVLMLPESISKECIDLRSGRAESELVVDVPEQELTKEMELVNKVRATLKSTLQKIEDHLAINKAAKHRIEYDWCDKTIAYNTETINLGLNPKSNTLLFKPGAIRFGDNTALLTYWEFYCRQNIEHVEAVRQNSADLRSTFNAMLINNGRKLREQADKTDKALAETVSHTSELITKLEEHLKHTLQSIADVEVLIKNLQDSVRKSDTAMKLAQTRLDNRNIGRPHGENVRDQPHLGLIHEVKIIHETVTSLLGQLRNAEHSRQMLMQKRVELEKDMAAKRKTLNIDRDRCGMIRSHYPTASELAGL